LEHGLAPECASAPFDLPRDAPLHLEDPLAQLGSDFLNWDNVLGQHLGGLNAFTPRLGLLEVQMPVMSDEGDLSERLSVIKGAQVIRYLPDLLQTHALPSQVGGDLEGDEILKAVEPLSAATLARCQARTDEVTLVPVLKLPQGYAGERLDAFGRERSHLEQVASIHEVIIKHRCFLLRPEPG
jgi:hypothetical protein